MFSTTKHLIFDLPLNLILLRTIAMPIPAHNLSVANGEFDQAILTRETIGVSVSGIVEFQNRNRVISTVESDQGIYFSFGFLLWDQAHINLAQQQQQLHAKVFWSSTPLVTSRQG
jgi:hypothetical protein